MKKGPKRQESLTKENSLQEAKSLQKPESPAHAAADVKPKIKKKSSQNGKVRKKKGRGSGVLLLLLLIVGLSLLLYPSFANYWNDSVQSRAMASFVEVIDQMDTSELDKVWEDAEKYNEALKLRQDPYTITPTLRTRYNRMLNVSGTGIMGYIDIPTINVSLPLYHGTSESVLQTSIGHLDWTYLPVGGEGTHVGVSGHRGLPSARLFTDLDEVKEGDIFILQILNRTLTYEVDQVLTVYPEDVVPLLPEPGQDYCTLITCTPYGVNTHRLLVRGHRIENIPEIGTVRILSEAIQIEPFVVAPVLAIPMLLLFVIWVIVNDIQKQQKAKARARAQAMISKPKDGGK